MEKLETARVFKNGRSQAIRIPASYRFSCDQVYIHRNSKTGDLTLSERPFAPSQDEIYAQLDAAGAEDFILDRDDTFPIERESF